MRYSVNDDDGLGVKLWWVAMMDDTMSLGRHTHQPKWRIVSK